MKHEILYSRRTSELNETISNRISDGWLLYGGLTVFVEGNASYPSLLQSMIKLESHEKIEDLIVPVNRLTTVE